MRFNILVIIALIALVSCGNTGKDDTLETKVKKKLIEESENKEYYEHSSGIKYYFDQMTVGVDKGKVNTITLSYFENSGRTELNKVVDTDKIREDIDELMDALVLSAMSSRIDGMPSNGMSFEYQFLVSVYLFDETVEYRLLSDGSKFSIPKNMDKLKKIAERYPNIHRFDEISKTEEGRQFLIQIGNGKYEGDEFKEWPKLKDLFGAGL